MTKNNEIKKETILDVEAEEIKNDFPTEEDSEYSDLIVDSVNGYVLVQDGQKEDHYTYKVYEEDTGTLVTHFSSKEDCLGMEYEEYLDSAVADYFIEITMRADKIMAKRKDRKSKNKKSKPKNIDLDYSSSNYYSWEPPKGKTGFLDKLNKSDTLVIHCADKSTDMLSQIYDGKGWDVLTDGTIDRDELHELIKSHDRIVCLGHGTPGGLINVQGGGYVIGDDEAPLLKDKKIFAIWCYATEYFKHHDIGHGQFITKNVPSEVWEAAAVGYHVSAQYILENITYWTKCCGDVIEQAFSGDVAGAVKNAQEAYQAKYGNDENPDQKGVTDYNTDAIQVQP